MQNPLLVPELQELLEAGNVEPLRDFCTDCHPATVGELLSPLEPREAWAIIKLAEPERRAEIFNHLDEGMQEELAQVLERMEMGQLLSDLPPDDRANLFRHLSEERQDYLMPAIAQAEREDIRRLTSYSEGTAGAMMTSDYVTLAPGLTVAEALEQLRLVAPDKETIYYSYVVDSERRLIGFVSLRDLILARRDIRIEDMYHRDTIAAKTSEDQEEAAHKIQKYDLIALPVVNEDDVLVGIITHDDAIDIITQESTEDIEKLMAIGGSHESGSYMRTSPWAHLRKRAIWIAVLGIVGMFSGSIVERYESLLLQFTILAAFMPMLADAGGNTGSQAAALVIRGLALKEVETSDLPRILWKEFLVSAMLGILLAVIVFARVLFFARGGMEHTVRIGIAISCAVGLQVVSATLVGAFLPIFAARMKFDPAVVASPALTTIVDITGLMLYFGIASAILGL